MHLFISCLPYLENLLVEELQQLGISARRFPRGATAPLTMENVYLINYCSRLASRVLWPLAHFDCTNREDLYNEAKKIPWQEYLSLEQTFAIDSNVTGNPEFRNTHFAGLVVKDAICDTFREKTGKRPSIEVYNPEIQFHLFIHGTKATLSLDTSGSPLFKRGYRVGTFEAPLQETLASAILKISRYSPDDVLCDPMCGSGTILWEAALIATQTPSQYYRKHFAFMRHPLYREDEWLAVKSKYDALIQPLKPYSIFGGDLDKRAIASCHAIQKHTQLPIHFQHAHITHFKPLQQPTLVITNPPYGRRLQTSPDTYQALQKFLQNTCHGKSDASILSPLSHLPFKCSNPMPLIHGGLDIFLHSLNSQ